ncbi:hypothetical protein BJG93_09680 [Paraburkholderia sprentiae WSM5005]|uniref:Uncharacterized protein n=1 Tax=Paraburkholderia sprentiae WSM5005 TaxID=754502 RepID=A0A1I9YH46_9BURK|nr:hypothetical protein [Paraburkholderia sprentiae]APA85629.1 hypothetical protein BJG93_09680 [Paraburkholderia sprentiae WSM5005]
MSKTVAVFEPIYSPDQTLSCAAFLPLVRADNARPEWREFKILTDMYRTGEHLRHDFTGLFSPKFTLKSKIPGAAFVEFAQRHGESDICFINPFPQLAYWSYNVWMQGELAHPGLVRAAQALLDASGVDIAIRDTPRHGPGSLAYCNFWVGSQRFWQEYVGGTLLPIADFLEANPSHDAALGVMTDTLHTDPAPFLPFIIERLFSTYISLHPELPCSAYAFNAEEVRGYCINDFEKLLYSRMREKIDAADASGVFDAVLMDQMDTVCALWQQHFFDFYATRPHPHTGQTVQPP